MGKINWKKVLKIGTVVGGAVLGMVGTFIDDSEKKKLIEEAVEKKLTSTNK